MVNILLGAVAILVCLGIVFGCTFLMVRETVREFRAGRVRRRWGD